jgi:D-tyrosyl-tRNA(Tyr) deacylase
MTSAEACQTSPPVSRGFGAHRMNSLQSTVFRCFSRTTVSLWQPTTPSAGTAPPAREPYNPGMRVLLQRVAKAAVSVDRERVAEIGAGFVALVGVGHGDTPETATRLAAKTVKLRVFGDHAGLMNLSLEDIGGAVLAVSQFTLYADTRKGNRPSFTGAAPPEQGEAVYEAYVAALRAAGAPVETGVFGAHMEVELVNDGPVTIMLEA